MGRVERISSTTPIPVERAQLIDPNAFRFSTAGPEALKAIGGVLEELGRRKIEMQDRIGISNINAAMENAQREYQEEIINKPLEEHAAILLKYRNNAIAFATQQKLSPDTRKLADNKLGIWGDSFADAGEIATIKAIERDAIIAVTSDYEKALTNGTVEDIAEAENALDEQFKGSYEPAEAKVLKEKVEQRAIAKMEENAVSNVHAALEAGDFGIAKELAKNPLIPEPKQTSLRNTIKTAENAQNIQAKEARQLVIDKTTSDTIREYFANDLTVAALNERHEKGLIKDSEFKFMMTGLDKKTPDNTDPFAAGRIRRAYADFEMGVINREEADKIVLENYLNLDGPDRSTVVADLEDIATKVIATAQSNAYSEGKGLMSRRFVGIQSEEDLIDLFRGAGLTDEEKQRINRRWQAEVNNRDLYERAIDDRFREMRKEGISSGKQYDSESLDILLQYQRRSSLTLEELEVEVTKEQKGIIRKKGLGFLGELPITFPTGKTGVATEFSIGVKIDGKETEIPTLVPTLTQNEIDLMVNDIIPNNKKVPDSIMKKAVAHAKKRIKQGVSPFAIEEERSTKIKPVSEMTTAEKQKELERIRELKRLAK